MYRTMIEILNRDFLPTDLNINWYTNINEKINRFQIYYNEIIYNNYKKTQKNTNQHIESHNNKHENNHDIDCIKYNQ